MYGKNSLVDSNSEWNRNESIYGRQRGALTRTYTIEYKTFENGIQAEIRIFAFFSSSRSIHCWKFLSIESSNQAVDDEERRSGRTNEKKDEGEEPGDEKVSQFWLELRV